MNNHVTILEIDGSALEHNLNYFKKKLSELNGVPEANIDPNNDNLYSYSWPGNIRELRNLIERVTILSVNEDDSKVDKILSDILKQDPKKEVTNSVFKDAMSFPLKEAREQFEKEYLSNQLKKNHGNISNLKITNRAGDFYDLLIDIEVQNVKHLTEIIAALRASPVTHTVDRARG